MGNVVFSSELGRRGIVLCWHRRSVCDRCAKDGSPVFKPRLSAIAPSENFLQTISEAFIEDEVKAGVDGAVSVSQPVKHQGGGEGQFVVRC